MTIRHPRTARLYAAVCAVLLALSLLALSSDRAHAATPGAMLLVSQGVTDTTISVGWQDADDSSPVTIGWQDESSPNGSSTWEGHYPARTDHLTLTGLHAAHTYWIYVTLDGPGYVPASARFTTTPAARTVAPPPVTRPTCQPRRLATKTAIAAARDGAYLRVGGFTSYWTLAGWQPANPVDYRLTLQRKTGPSWTAVTTITPGSRPALLIAPRGTYRLAFLGACSLPGVPSASTALTR